MTEANQEQTTETVAAPIKKERKPKEPKVKKLTREKFLVEKHNAGLTNVEELAKAMEAEIASGNLRVRPTLRKIEVSTNMWIAQVKWYLHQARRKGLISGEVTTRARKAKAEKPVASEQPAQEAVTATPTVAAAQQEDIGGTL
jgi:hypothetical protein